MPIFALLFGAGLKRAVTSGLIIAVVLGFVIFLVVNKCGTISEDKARIEHNDQRRDDFVKKEGSRAKLHQEREKSKFFQAPKVKKYTGKKLSKDEVLKARERNILDIEGNVYE